MICLEPRLSGLAEPFLLIVLIIVKAEMISWSVERQCLQFSMSMNYCVPGLIAFATKSFLRAVS